jgi:putative RecB family exonuclease
MSTQPPLRFNSELDFAPRRLAKESSFTSLLMAATGEVLEERLVGALDLVIGDGDKHIVVEHKTAAKKWSQDQVQHDIQLSAYRLVAGKLGLGDVGLRLQVLTKTKKPAMVIENTERGDKDIQDFLATVVGVLRAVDAGCFYPMRSSMCGGCAFQRRCRNT